MQNLSYRTNHPSQTTEFIKEKNERINDLNHNCTLQGLLNGDEGWFPSQLVQEIENKVHVCIKHVASPFEIECTRKLNWIDF